MEAVGPSPQPATTPMIAARGRGHVRGFEDESGRALGMTKPSRLRENGFEAASGTSFAVDSAGESENRK